MTKANPPGLDLKLPYLRLFLFLRFLLFIFRKGKEGEREGDTHQCVVASQAPPTRGPSLQPRHMP